VVLGNGTVKKIKDMGTHHLQKINVPVRVKGKETEKATTFQIYENQPVIEIITESGKSLKGSLNQPVLVVKGIGLGGVERFWKRLDELEIGDRVAVAGGISCWKKTHVLTGWKKMDRKFGPKFKGRFPGYWNLELGALDGYILGDGYVRKNKGEIIAIVNDKETELMGTLVKYFRKLFGVESVIEKIKSRSHLHKGRLIKSKSHVYRITARSKDVANALDFLNRKRVPDPIFLSPNTVVKEFLRWFFQADGCVFSKGRGRRAVQLKQKETELLRDVQMLLLRFGIHSRIYDNNLTIRRGYDMIKFAKNIGFAGKKKQAALSDLAEAAKKFRRVKRQLSERVVTINRLKEMHTVYDIEVPKSHRFIANGIVVHNSGKTQLMKLVPQIVPRGKYVSGKGVSTAGLTATVIKDEQFMGGWVLEAGAVVLANKGLLSVDEFEKMAEEDQVAMHEAMESGSVSIAKASIVATLPAQTSILAGGNPTFGRFDPTISIKDQIKIPPTLLTRFDLKFILKDEPSSERDGKVVDHILRTREDEKYEEALPKIDPNLVRKYIAYAKNRIVPELTTETGKLLKDFYVGVRKKAETEGAPVPITLRQFEALIRLSEASAKIQLSDKVRVSDVQRAIRLMQFSLRDLGYDITTKSIDIDKAEGGVTSSERSKIRSVMAIINTLSQKEKEIKVDKIVDAAVKEGVEDAEEIIERMVREGVLFHPSPGFVQKV